jgi:gluconokinase
MSLVPPPQAEAPLVLSVDVGTSSVRALVYDRAGRALEGLEARHPHEIQVAPDGASEADPDQLLDGIYTCIDQVLARAGKRRESIAAVAACTFVGNVLGIDQEGRAVTPLITYADTRATHEAAALRRELDATAAHQRTGCHFHSSYLPARLRWVATARPDFIRATSRWVTLWEYLELKLFGSAAASYSVASWSGLLNRETLGWDEELLAALPVEADQLSALVDLTDPRQGLLPGFAARWPELAGVPWFPAVGDGAAANVGSGCVTPSRVALTIGTTSAARIVTQKSLASVPSGLWCYRVDSRRALPGGALSEGGNLIDWIQRLLHIGEEDRQTLEKQIASRSPGCHNLTILPLLSGERSPGWADQARGTIHGLSLATEPVDIFQASLEAIAYRLALVVELLGPLLPSNARLVASGGALLGSGLWRQMIADVLERPLAIPQVYEPSARGAALLALESLGAIPSLGEVRAPMNIVNEPDPRRSAAYREERARQQALYEKLISPVL